VVISESWSSWTDRPLGNSATHNKLSSRSRKSVEDILEAAKRRQLHAEQSLQANASARAQRLQSERDHEAAVRQRHDDAIKAVGENTARKQAHAEAVRLAKLQQQAARLKRDAEHAERVRQRKLVAPQSGGDGGDGASGGAGTSSTEEDERLIDLPWTMFGERKDAQGGGRDSLAIDNPLHAKLSSRSRKTVEEVMEASQRRMAAAEEAVKARDAQQQEKSARENARREGVHSSRQQAINDLAQTSNRKMQAAEEKRAAKLNEQAARLQREKERAEEVRRRRLESPEQAPPSDATETPAGSPTPSGAEKAARADAIEQRRRKEVLATLAQPVAFHAEMELDGEGKPLTMSVPAGAWEEKRSARGADLHLKLSARTRKAPEEVLQDHKRRQAAAEALRRAREQKERERLEREREREDQVRLRIEVNAQRKQEAVATKSDEKMMKAEGIARRKAARESLRAERKRQREKSAKVRQQNATRIFGTTVLDDDDKLRLLKVVKENKLGELEEMATGGELGRLRNFQNHYGDSALILAAWYGHLDIAKLLLDVNADVDIANCDGNTALNCAAYRGHHQMVELLLIEGSEVDVQDNVTGKTALIKASYGGHTKVVTMLLEAEADPDAVDSQGYGALAFAASFGHREVLQGLLEYDADPDVADQFGITPLIHAAARGDFLAVKMLLEAGATATKEDVEGKSAIDYADSAGFDDVVGVIAEYAEKDPNSAGKLQSSAGAVTQRLLEAENENGQSTNRQASAREYSMCATERNKQKSQRDYSSNVPGLTPRVAGVTTARGSSSTRLTPRMPPPLPSNRPRMPLTGVGDSANALGTPRGFRGMSSAPTCDAKIEPTALSRVDQRDMTYLTKKLFNLSMLLEQDTVLEDVSYPKFPC